jgi:hypothetical protein
MDLSELASTMKRTTDNYLAEILAMAAEDGIITGDQGLRILRADYGGQSRRAREPLAR